MRAFVFPLLQAGYRVIAYDQPAHGVSEGRLTGLPDFADVLADVVAYHGNIGAVIAHSLGGAAAAVALSSGKISLKKVVLVSPPSDLVGYSRRFARWYWMPEPVRKAMQTAIEERYGVLWEDLEVPRVAPRLSAEALVIHDREDRMMPWTHGATVARHWPGARLFSTDGLGHRRILADEKVTRIAAEFIAGRATEVDSPAPLY
jgi:pimeloyl-ACP methyl ester carboxylesterase